MASKRKLSEVRHDQGQYPLPPKTFSQEAFRIGQLLDRGVPRAQARPLPMLLCPPQWIDWAEKPGDHGPDAEYDTSWTQEKIAQYKVEQEHGGWINFSAQALSADTWADYQVWHYNRQQRRQKDNWWSSSDNWWSSSDNPGSQWDHTTTADLWDPSTLEGIHPPEKTPANPLPPSLPHEALKPGATELGGETPKNDPSTRPANTIWIDGVEYHMTPHGMDSETHPLDHSQSVVWNGVQHVVFPPYEFPTNHGLTPASLPAHQLPPAFYTTPIKSMTEASM
jgi:hypothetical protein